MCKIIYYLKQTNVYIIVNAELIFTFSYRVCMWHGVICNSNSNDYFFTVIVIVIEDCECSVIVLVIVIDQK